MYTWLLLLALSGTAYASDLSDAQAAMEAGKIDDARDFFSKARKEDSEAAQAWRGLAQLAARGDAKSLAALQSGKSTALGKAALGWLAYYKASSGASLDRNLAAEADNWFHDALDQQADLPLALLGLGTLQQAQGDLAAGLATLLNISKQPGTSWATREVNEARRRWFDAYVVAFLGEPGANPFLLENLPVPYDVAFRRQLDETLGAATRASNPSVARRGQKLAQKLASNPDPCTSAVAQTWAGMLELRLEGQATGLESIRNAAPNLARCGASEDRVAWNLLRMAEAQAQVGDPRQGLEAAREAGKALEASPRGQAEAALLEGEVALLIPDLEGAQAAANRAQALYAQLNQPLFRVRLLQARLLQVQGSPEKALPILTELQGAMEKAEDDLGLVEVMVTLGQVQAAVGQEGPGLSSLDQASQIAGDAAFARGKATAELQIARLSLQLNDTTQALSHATTALNAFETMENARGQAAVWLLRAQAYRDQGDNASAGDAVKQALTRLRPGGPSLALAEVLLEGARLAAGSGDSPSAATYLDEAQVLFDTLRLPDGKERVLAERLRLDPLLDALAAVGVSWPRAATSVNGWSRLAPIYGSTVNPKLPASDLQQLAEAALKRGEAARALEALELAMDSTSPSDRAQRLVLLQRLAEAQLACGNLPRAGQLLDLVLGASPSPALHLLRARLALYSRDAARLTEELPLAADPAAKQELALLAARLKALNGDLPGAVVGLQEQQKISRQASDTKGLARVLVEAMELGGAPGTGAVNEALSLADASGDPTLPLRARLAWLSSAGKIEAKPALKLVDLLDGLRNSGQRPPQLQSWTALRPRLLEAAVALFSGNQADAAFRLLATAQFQNSLPADWIALSDRRNLRNQKSKDPFPADVVTASLVDAGARLDSLDRPMDQLYSAALAGKAPSEAGQVLVERHAATLRGATSAWQAMLPGEEGKLRTPHLQDLQATLAALDARGGPPCRLLAYHPQKEGLVIEVIGASSYQLLSVGPADLNPPAGPMAALVQRLVDSLSRGERNQEAELSALHRWLVAPIKDLPNDAPLLIVADGSLAAVPFTALRPETGDPLGRHHLLVQLPTTTSLLRPQLPREGDVGDPPTTLQFGTAHASLPRAVPETATCGAGPQPACSQGATVTGFQAMVKEEYDLMELRVPAFALPSPWLDAPPLAGLQVGDGVVWAHRLAHSLFHTDLLVLPQLVLDSTSTERLERAGGLAEALLTTRIRSVLWSRWAVDPQVEKIFLDTFYKNWAQHVGKPNNSAWWKAEALAAAQQAVREYGEGNPYASPSNWAGYTLSGAPN